MQKGLRRRIHGGKMGRMKELPELGTGSCIQPIVFIAGTFDILHYGHIRLIRRACKYGLVIVGLVDDESACRYKGLPVMSYKQRLEVIRSIRGVWKVERFNSDYEGKNAGNGYLRAIRKYHPDYVIHGSDWKKRGSPLCHEYKIIKKELDRYGGKVIMVPYTKGVSSTLIKKTIVERLFYGSRRDK